MQRNKFFLEVAKAFGRLNQSQVTGFIHILNRWEETSFNDIRWLAYMLATTWHETARTMQPITEYGSQKYLQGKKYYPYIGRGYVQLTWKKNYERYGIARTPEKALDPDYAAFIMIDGMTKGVFTGRKLNDYFNEDKNDPIGARRIINGTDKDKLIASYYNKFLIALKV
jgi:putative chitinase